MKSITTSRSLPLLDENFDIVKSLMFVAPDGSNILNIGIFNNNVVLYVECPKPNINTKGKKIKLTVVRLGEAFNDDLLMHVKTMQVRLTIFGEEREEVISFYELLDTDYVKI